MPVWYLDLKIPLVNTKYEMTDISNPDIGIFPTPDSMGFQIVQGGEMEPQVLPNLPTLPMDLDAVISTGELPGIPPADIVIPFPEIGQRIPLTTDSVFYPTSTFPEVLCVFKYHSIVLVRPSSKENFGSHPNNSFASELSKALLKTPTGLSFSKTNSFGLQLRTL